MFFAKALQRKERAAAIEIESIAGQMRTLLAKIEADPPKSTAAVNKWWEILCDSASLINESRRRRRLDATQVPDEYRRRRPVERDGLERPRRHEQEERARGRESRARGGMNYRPLFYHHHHPCTEDAVSASKTCPLPSINTLV